MTSILTNTSALAALSTLRSINSSLGAEQGKISSGLRIQSAADNAAYWSIATTMRSDNKAIATVHDALGLAAAKIDVSYSAMSAVKDVLDEIKTKLVAAKEPGVDKAKIQKEIDQLAQSTRSIADSASFAGENWLSTDISGLIDTTLPLRSSTLVSSFNRSASGNIGIGTTTVDHLETALFNKEGGGILEADPRSPKSIAGIRSVSSAPIGSPWYSPTGYTDGRGTSGYEGNLRFTFAGPLDFATASDRITFDITLDAEDPASTSPGPYAPGNSYSVTINRSVVDSVLPFNGGKIDTASQMAAVLRSQLNSIGASASTYYYKDLSDPYYFKFDIYSRETNGLNGSAVQISNFSSTVGSGGLQNGLDYGKRYSLDLDFEAFEVYQSVDINFDFHFNRESPTSHVINRALVNSVLGTTNGKIETSSQWAQILNTLITRPDTIIAATSATTVNVKTDPNVDRLNGFRTGVHFSNVSVNIEPIPQTGIFGIDIVSNSGSLDKYIIDVELMTQKTIDGAAMLGALKARIDMQSGFTKTLIDTVDKGVGQLVDADLNDASARQKALQAQQQLAIQALSIANSNTDTVLSLFN
ncbi:Flagellin FlgL [Rhizobium sp. RU20A]|uniref:flagellin N-terminal helical domain-containing protein n=1 Tax=Rhizobium sp. RU20A TaxID=1907412 RepID=UPI00095672A7|nr:flagellin [Rhizobium sp. RU20A]SIR05121.1 Flagellin FlgL [Rhizobium sp. RU20A]